MPHAGQRYVREHAERFTWLSAGRRWRKTTLAMTICIEEALKGKGIVWGAPVYDQVRTCWDETLHAAPTVGRFSKSEMTVYFGGKGGRIIFRSLDNPDNVRGKTADGVVIDEVADVNPLAWYEVLRPMLIDTNGWSWGIGTPRGRNWFWIEFMAALSRTDTAAFNAPTLGVDIVDGKLLRNPHPLENPNIPFAEIENLYRTMPERSFRQEIMGEFIDDGGSVFRRIREAATATRQDAPIPGHLYIMGCDWARSFDATVLTVIDATTRQVCYVDRMLDTDYRLQTARLRALAERFNVAQIVAEANSMGGPLVEQLLNEGLPVLGFTTTNASKALIIDGLALAFERGELAILDDAQLIAELQAYEAERLPGGMIRYGAPEGMHDDCVISLALAWSAAQNAGLDYVRFV
jgi:hypothetical protein